jgi:hypothetical protein
MTILTFLAGFIAGAGAILLLAVYLAKRSKPQPVAQNSVAAISMKPNGNDMSIDAFNARMLKDILARYEGQA